MALASLLCAAVFEGDLKLLRRLLRAGADVNAGDYDQRTALHVAAAEGNLAAVRGSGAAPTHKALQPAPPPPPPRTLPPPPPCAEVPPRADAMPRCAGGASGGRGRR